jgi:hypothetical protein
VSIPVLPPHAYRLLFHRVLGTAEIEHLVPLQGDVGYALLVRIGEQYRVPQGHRREDRVRRTVPLAGVASGLLAHGIAVRESSADLLARSSCAVLPDSQAGAYSPNNRHHLEDDGEAVSRLALQIQASWVSPRVPADAEVGLGC